MKHHLCVSLTFALTGAVVAGCSDDDAGYIVVEDDTRTLAFPSELKSGMRGFPHLLTGDVTIGVVGSDDPIKGLISCGEGSEGTGECTANFEGQVLGGGDSVVIDWSSSDVCVHEESGEAPNISLCANDMSSKLALYKSTYTIPDNSTSVQPLEGGDTPADRVITSLTNIQLHNLRAPSGWVNVPAVPADTVLLPISDAADCGSALNSSDARSWSASNKLTLEIGEEPYDWRVSAINAAMVDENNENEYMLGLCLRIDGLPQDNSSITISHDNAAANSSEFDKSNAIFQSELKRIANTTRVRLTIDGATEITAHEIMFVLP